MSTPLPLVKMFPASASALSDVRRFVLARAEEASLPNDVADDLLIAVTEACSEMLAREVSSAMAVSWWVHEGSVEILVKDLGVTAYMVPAPGPDPDDEEAEQLFEGRLGFPHILAFIDEWEVRPGEPGDTGTVVRLARQLSSTEESGGSAGSVVELHDRLSI
jgi:anti-sigma regulatory factor (Ser/Thr protein kinase)